jgi:integrase
MKGCRPLSDEEIRVISKSFGGNYAKRDRALFFLGIKSGFRISELLSLRIRDVYQYGAIVDRVTVQRRNIKRKVEGRTVPIHPDAKAALSEWIAELGTVAPETFVFLSRKGVNRAIGRVQAYRILEEAYDTNGLAGKLGTHSMRKTFADPVYEKLGRDLVRTQRALGHRNINSTVSYLSFREEEIDAAILTA